MENNNENFWKYFVIWILGIVLFFVTMFTFALVRERNNFQDRREVCNRTVLTKEILPEGSGSYWWSMQNKSTLENVAENVDYVKGMVNETNKEVNRLRSLLGCYFDRK